MWSTRPEDTKLKRQVALKFLRSDILEDEEHKERFLREAQAAAALDYPGTSVWRPAGMIGCHEDV